jgi:hypothetical protein
VNRALEAAPLPVDPPDYLKDEILTRLGLSRAEAPVDTVALVPTPQEAARLDGYWGVAEIRPQPSDNQQVELRLNNFDEPEPDKYYEL